MVHVQPVKSVWSTLHKVLLQTVGNKPRKSEPSVQRLEVGDEENGAAKRTQEAFSLNFPKRSPAQPHAPPSLLIYYSNSVPVLQVFKISKVIQSNTDQRFMRCKYDTELNI